MVEQKLREEMCRIGRLLWERGLIGATEGNLTCRIHGGHVLATPTSRCKGTLEPQQLVSVNSSGVPIGTNTPSSEIGLHLCLYKCRLDCQAIVHAHPISATAYALCSTAPAIETSPEAMSVLGRIAVVPFAVPGTAQVANEIAPFAKDHNTFILANHGAVTLGASLEDAFNRMETLERFCKSSLLTRLCGTARNVPDEAIQLMLMQASVALLS